MTLFKTRDLEDHTNTLAYYLPGDELFAARFIPDTNLRLFLRALASELERYHSVLEETASEYDIRYTQNLLNEWESALGIPGTCFDNNGTFDQRRRNLLMKLRYLHGSTASDFIQVASLLGYTITIETAKRHGMFPAAFPIYFFPDGRATKFTMIIRLPANDAPVGFPLAFPIKFITPDNALLRCLFNRMKPANVNIVYIFT